VRISFCLAADICILSKMKPDTRNRRRRSELKIEFIVFVNCIGDIVDEAGAVVCVHPFMSDDGGRDA